DDIESDVSVIDTVTEYVLSEEKPRLFEYLDIKTPQDKMLPEGSLPHPLRMVQGAGAQAVSQCIQEYNRVVPGDGVMLTIGGFSRVEFLDGSQPLTRNIWTFREVNIGGLPDSNDLVSGGVECLVLE
ncbi:hypothetical protein N7490_006569, partial [Penicillium lividum]